MITVGLAKCMENRKQRGKYLKAGRRMGNVQEINFEFARNFGNLFSGKMGSVNIY